VAARDGNERGHELGGVPSVLLRAEPRAQSQARPQPEAAVSDFERALAAGVVTTREEFDALAAGASRFGASIDDVCTAIGRQSMLTLDSLGIHVRGPTTPEPDPEAETLHKLERMYGVNGPRRNENSLLLRVGAARRTAVAMERRRQGWTREAAYAEWRGQLVARVTAELER
jgi:hypothetical protein